MIKIIDYAVRKTKEGKSFISSHLQGDVEMVQSMNTGRFYATSKKCYMSCTFDEETAKSLIGSQMPGRIARVEVEPYDFTVPDTGEVIKLAHSYQYLPEEAQIVRMTSSSLVA